MGERQEVGGLWCYVPSRLQKTKPGLWLISLAIIPVNIYTYCSRQLVKVNLYITQYKNTTLWHSASSSKHHRSIIGCVYSWEKLQPPATVITVNGSAPNHGRNKTIPAAIIHTCLNRQCGCSFPIFFLKCWYSFSCW